MVLTENISFLGDVETDILIISDYAMLIYTWVVYAVLCQSINIFGIVTNIINIVCFVKQGFKDTVNISFVGLSVSDLGSLLTMVWTCICLTPSLSAADLPFQPMEVMYLVSAMPHFAFTRVSSGITAAITLETCLSIAAPLKIKSIATPKRVTIIIICISIVFFFSGAPVYAVNTLEIKFSPARNKSIFGIVFKENREYVEMISFFINNFLIPFVSFVMILACTIILSVQLRSKNEWRKKMTSTGQSDRLSSRNQKVAKMVVTISSLFIICFVPITVIMLALAFEPSVSLNGKYLHLAISLAGVGYILEGVNSSMNIFIYYHMSQKYREAFHKLLMRKQPRSVLMRCLD